MSLRILLVLFALLFTSNVQAQSPSKQDALQTLFDNQKNKSFPQFSVMLQDGRRLNSDSIKGKVLFANFWFESCNPCRAEFKALNALYDSLKDNPEFVFIAFTFEPAARLPKIINDYKLRFPIASITRTECERLKLIGMGYPTSIITDKLGKVMYYHAGGPGSVEKANEKFKTEILPVILSQL